MTNFDSWLSPAQRAAIEATSPNNFKTVEFMTAEEKKKVLDHWRKFMTWLATNGVPTDMPKAFSKVIYQHLITHASGFIGHYDQRGFWHAQLGTPESAMEFFKDLEEHLLCQWGALRDYADVNTALMDAARQARPGILQALKLADQKHARAQIALLARRAGLTPGTSVTETASAAIARTSCAATSCASAAPTSAMRAPAIATPHVPLVEAQAELF